MEKSEMQINFEKARMAVRIISETTQNPDNIQMYIVREFYNHYNNDNNELAYEIINEAFNKNLVAGYKYLECCELAGHKGEFYEIAIQNPLMNL